MSDDPALWSTSRQAQAIRTGEISSRELLELYINRIESINGELNAVVTQDFAAARIQADAADKALAAGESSGPLHGIPVTIKDALEVRGMRSTGGAVELSNHIPDQDAPVVAAVRGAGANIIGKTNLPRWSADIQAYNEIFGQTGNPWNLERVPGGSSGGAAAAVAAGLSSFEIGTDIGGSIRFPAAFCGVFGHKPSFGLVPSSGYLDHAAGGTTEADVNVIGPIDRSAEDLELLLTILLRQEEPWKIDLESPSGQLNSLRVGTWLNDDFCPVDDIVLERTTAAAAALKTAGFNLVGDRKPAIDPSEASNLAMALVSAAMLQSGEDPGYTHRAWLEHHQAREAIREAWARLFEDIDILLMPVSFVPPFTHIHEGDFSSRTLLCNGETRAYADLVKWTMLVGMAYLPSTVPPIGLGRNGLPVGIQVVGKYGADLTTIRFAGALAELMGGYQPPPIALAAS